MLLGPFSERLDLSEMDLFQMFLAAGKVLEDCCYLHQQLGDFGDRSR